MVPVCVHVMRLQHRKTRGQATGQTSTADLAGRVHKSADSVSYDATRPAPTSDQPRPLTLDNLLRH